MARIARVIAPGLPHHVTQRGNGRQRLFVEEGDYALYRDLLAERCRANGVSCWAYCLMPNHVHLILAPSSAVENPEKPPSTASLRAERSNPLLQTP
jgi:REP-associated tyrosine transposase